jgi:hypothetical protein
MAHVTTTHSEGQETGAIAPAPENARKNISLKKKKILI